MRFSWFSSLGDIADDGLSSSAHIDMLDDDLLLSASPVPLESLHLQGEGAGTFVEGTLGTVLLRYVFSMGEPPGEGHCGHMNGSHLGAQQGLDLGLWLDALYDAKHEIHARLIGFLSFGRCVRKLIHKAVPVARGLNARCDLSTLSHMTK
jgi:hypothetical protein